MILLKIHLFILEFPVVKRSQYDREVLKNAVASIQRGEVTIYAASRKYGIPKETLRRHVKGKVTDFRKPGRDFLLTLEEEQAVVDYIGYCSRHNFPLKRQDLRSIILVRLMFA